MQSLHKQLQNEILEAIENGEWEKASRLTSAQDKVEKLAHKNVLDNLLLGDWYTASENVIAKNN